VGAADRAPLELVLPDRTRLPLVSDVTIGRATGSTVRLDDPSVSRAHARIRAADGGAAVLEDAGSSYGTWLDGERLRAPAPLHDGAHIRLGDQTLVVERQRGESDAGHTIVVGVDESIAMPARDGSGTETTAGLRFGGHPRARSGYALKRLEAGEGPERWVLKNLRSEEFVRMSDADAAIFQLLDGSRSLPELVRESERAAGPDGPARLARLLAELADRGLLAGPGDGAGDDRPQGRFQRLARPRRLSWPGAADWIDRVYRDGGWVLFKRSVLMVFAVVALGGLGVFAYLVAGRYGTPFVVASKLGIGGLVFFVGRFAVAAVHETAHGLAMAHFGRRIQDAGLKLVLIFPYAYVDTSDAWFEPRRRRMAVTAAGPVSDMTIGGAFSLYCLVLPPSTLRDIFFQLAFGAYLGAFYNLNPFLDRDGYQLLVDLLREPRLRERAREQFARLIAVGPGGAEAPALTRYSLFGLGWSVIGGSFLVAMSFRYQPVLAQLMPPALVWTIMGTMWVGLFTPALAMVGLPLYQRYRSQAR
jgi:putative peptide zinc metalloprotease protein